MAGPDVVLRVPKSNNNNKQNVSYNDQSLWQKWENHYYGREQNPNLTRMSNRLSVSYFLFICTSELYVALRYVIPWYYVELDPWTQYWIKVFCVFIFIQTIANWLCVTFTSTNIFKTADKPDPTNKKQQTPETEFISLCMHDIEDVQPVSANSVSDKQKHVFGWRRCEECDIDQPPRAHHCRICRKCILKRDHHCYMSGVCVGFWNQRYFVIMNFYIAIASIYGVICIYSYYVHHVHADWLWTDFVLPWTLVKWLTGSFDFHMMLMTFHLYTLWWTGPVAASFFFWQMLLIYRGLTNREFRSNLRVRCTASVSDKFRSVFGAFWLINFIFPAQIIFRQVGDGVHWKNVRTY